MSILHRWPDIERLQQDGMPLPHMVAFITANRCNHHCMGCAYGGKHDNEIMPETQHFKIVDEFLALGLKAFEFCGGGEPTTLPYLAKIMRHVVQNGGHFSLLTNGTLLDRETIDLLVASGTYVRVSLEASNPQDYVAYKGVPVFHWDRALKNIRLLVDEKRRTGSTLEIAARFSVGKSLRGERHYLDCMELAKELELDRFTVKALRHEPEELSEPERIEEQEICDLIAAEWGMDARCHSWIAPLERNKTIQCWLNPLHVIVDEKGDCYICCFHYYRKERHFLGNMFKERFLDFWYSTEHYRKIKEIRPAECAQVDCKFVKHTEAVERFQERGMGYWV